MSNQVFNPDDWNAAPAEKVPQALSPSVAASSNLSTILAVVDAVEASGIDITPTYEDWLSIAFALVSELGEDGRNIFHRLSRFNPHYEYEETDRQYSHCLKDGSREITLGTLFHIAQTHGVRWESPPLRGGAEGGGVKSTRRKSSSQLQFEDGEDLRMSKSVKIGTFSQNVSEQLPDILKRIVADAVSAVDADLLILGSLTVFSACLPKVYGIYDRREVFSNLFLYVTARASAGKGRLSLCRHLAEPIHRELKEKYRKSMDQYKQDLRQYNLNKKDADAEEPEEPPFLTLFIPANSTATVVYKTLSQNDGVGLLFETEGDTLANAFNSDLGNYSDGFRKAFHHETISYLRKKDREYVEIPKPKFSAILSGTPEQVFNLIPSAENGLFSRFIFYVMPTEIVWRDMFDENEVTADEVFKEIGKDFYQFHKMLSEPTIHFKLTADQRQRFHDFFTMTQLEYANIFGDDIIASVRRLGLILFRFAMILTVLRQMDENNFPLPIVNVEGKRPESILECADADFATALAMIKVLLQHTASVFQTLPRHEFRKPNGHRNTNDRRQAFYAALPNTFDRAAYLQAAASLGVTEKTAERYISELCKSSLLAHPAIDNYQKNPGGVP